MFQALIPALGVAIAGTSLFLTFRQKKIPPAVAQAAVNSPPLGPAPQTFSSVPLTPDVAAVAAQASALIAQQQQAINAAQQQAVVIAANPPAQDVFVDPGSGLRAQNAPAPISVVQDDTGVNVAATAVDALAGTPASTVIDAAIQIAQGSGN